MRTPRARVTLWLEALFVIGCVTGTLGWFGVPAESALRGAAVGMLALIVVLAGIGTRYGGGSGGPGVGVLAGTARAARASLTSVNWLLMAIIYAAATNYDLHQSVIYMPVLMVAWLATYVVQPARAGRGVESH